METIRILFYTDKFDISANNHLWGLTFLERFITLKMKGIAAVRFTLLNRHFDYEKNRCVDGATRLTSKLLKDHDELWVFGSRQANTKRERKNELQKGEIAALRGWMQTGGVLITGDHSDAVGKMTCQSDHRVFVNLGAAIGRNMPRAGQMRVWDGPPTGCYEGPLELRDNHNTQAGSDPLQLDNLNLQSDSFPQTLHLTPSDPPHKLFWWYVDPSSQAIVPIVKFPDHIHEGDLGIPTKLNDWPAPSPLPTVVAFGRDKRFPKEERLYRVVAAYDGDASRVGRIVADSSFHHYIDRNLFGIPARAANGDPEPGSDLDQIAQYYCNLALWLAPQSIRARIAWGLFFWTAIHPDVLEDKANGPQVVGQTAMNVLLSEIGISNLYRLLAPSELEQNVGSINLALASVLLGLEGPAKSPIQAELVLGHIVYQYHQFFADIGLSDPGSLKEDPEPTKIILRGLENALGQLDGVHELLVLFRTAAQSIG